jgi:triosephosphate isomerase
VSPIFGTNWKMRNVDRAAARAYARVLLKALPQMKGARLFVLPPVTLIRDMAEECGTGDQLIIGAQNVHWAKDGEFTGEISSRLLRQEGARIVMVGHAERRLQAGESDQLINRKVRRALEDGFEVVLCVGDAHADLTDQALEQTFEQQIGTALGGVGQLAHHRLIVAYEPIWAIGEAAQQTPTAHRVASTVQVIRRALKLALGGNGRQVPVLYGGSVSRQNSRELAAHARVDGLFVGRAAREPEQFVALILDAMEVLPGA